MNRQSRRAELGVESHDEWRPDEDAYISRLGSASCKDEGISCAGAGELIVGDLLAGEEDEELFEDREDACDGGDGGIESRKVFACVVSNVLEVGGRTYRRRVRKALSAVSRLTSVASGAGAGIAIGLARTRRGNRIARRESFILA